jgi:hypothetical protein
MGKKSRR